MNSVESFIANHANLSQRLILEQLDELIRSYPNISSKISYRVPFYVYHKNICYLHPKKNGEVNLCFINAIAFNQELNWLESKGRKQIKSMTFTNPKTLPFDKIILSLEEAIETDIRLRH